MSNPNNWYWIVAGSTTEVFSSASLSYVAPTDATYSAWLAQGNQPTRIASAGELLAVLKQQLLPVLASAGVAIQSTGTPALNGTYAIDPASVSDLQAIANGIANGKGCPGGGSSFNYPDASLAMHSFTAAAFIDLGDALVNYLYAANQALSTAVAGGTASLPTQPVTIA